MVDQRQLLRCALDEFCITDPETRAGIAAVIMGETGFNPRTEGGYGHTDNARIRTLFSSRVAGMSDAALSCLKSNDELFFSWIYGGVWGLKNLGNTDPTDGYRFVGRGDVQLTGRSNYTRYGQKLGLDLISHPELVNDPTVAARLAVAYVVDRYHGGGWDTLKRCVGNSVASTEAVKDAAYAQYLAGGEFAAA